MCSPVSANGGIAAGRVRRARAYLAPTASTKLLGEEYVRAVLPPPFHRAHRLAVQLLRQELRQDHGAAWAKPTARSTVVNDQLGNPTNAVDLAYHILKLAVSHDYGIYHCTGNGVCSWYDFACDIMHGSRPAAAR